MLGLIVILVLGGYLALSIFLVVVTYKSQRKKGRAGRKAWLPAVLVGLVMYLLVFWDHIPTIVAHNYYCDKYAGLTVYKTLEEWKEENPGVVETLSLGKESGPFAIDKNTIRFKLNQIVVYDTVDKGEVLNIIRRTSLLRDEKNNMVLVKYVDFNTDIMNFSLGTRGFRDYKFWLSRNSCEPVINNINFNKFRDYKRGLQNMEG